MEFRQLEYFLKIYEYQSFTEAAKALYISQPALSKAVKRLEDELGVTLFIINGKRIVPTPAGRMLYDQSQKVSLLYDDILSKVANMQKHAHGDVRIMSSLMGGAQIWLFDMMKVFNGPNHDVHFYVKELNQEEILKAVESGQTDIGLSIRFGENVPQGVTCVTILESQLYLVTNKNNPMAKAEIMDYSLLSGQNIFVNHEEICRRIAYKCRNLGFLPDVFMVSNHTDVMATLASADHGIAILELTPDSMAQYTSGYNYLELFSRQGECVCRKLTGPEFSYQLVMYTGSEIVKNKCAEQFKAFLINNVGRLGDVHFGENQLWEIKSEL